jgi:hypothetical protein
MPYGGQCLNVGRLEYQPKASACPAISGRLCRRAPTMMPSIESPGLTSGENSPWEHRLGRSIVELNDEGEHQVEQVAVLSREVETNNVAEGSDGFGFFAPLG